MDVAEQLIVEHIDLPTVVYHRLRHHSQIAFLGREEAVSAGNVALVRCAQAANLNPATFRNYAWRAIARALFEAAAESGPVRVPACASARGVPIPHTAPLDVIQPSYAAGQMETLIRTEDAAAVRAAVDQLPPDWRDVIELRYFEDMTLEAVAIELHVSPQAVAQREQKALARLKGLLQGTHRRRGRSLALQPV